MQYLIDTIRFCRNAEASAEVSRVYRKNEEYFSKMISYIKGLGKGMFMVDAETPHEALLSIYGSALNQLDPVRSNDYKIMLKHEAVRQYGKPASGSVMCLEPSGKRKKQLEPVKRMLLKKLDTKKLREAARNENILDEKTSWCIGKIEETGSVTSAYSDEQAYYRFCIRADLPSWYQGGMVNLIRRNSDKCMTTLKRGLLPKSDIMKNRMAEYMADLSENFVKGENRKERKKRLRVGLDTRYAKGRRSMKRSKVQKPPGTRRGELIKDYLRTEKLFTGQPVEVERRLPFTAGAPEEDNKVFLFSAS